MNVRVKLQFALESDSEQSSFLYLTPLAVSHRLSSVGVLQDVKCCGSEVDICGPICNTLFANIHKGLTYMRTYMTYIYQSCPYMIHACAIYVFSRDISRHT